MSDGLWKDPYPPESFKPDDDIVASIVERAREEGPLPETARPWMNRGVVGGLAAAAALLIATFAIGRGLPALWGDKLLDGAGAPAPQAAATGAPAAPADAGDAGVGTTGMPQKDALAEEPEMEETPYADGSAQGAKADREPTTPPQDDAAHTEAIEPEPQPYGASSGSGASSSATQSAASSTFSDENGGEGEPAKTGDGADMRGQEELSWIEGAGAVVRGTVKEGIFAVEEKLRGEPEGDAIQAAALEDGAYYAILSPEEGDGPAFFRVLADSTLLPLDAQGREAGEPIDEAALRDVITKRGE